MSVLAEISAYLESHERANAEPALSLIRESEDPFSRSNLSGHITGSAFVVDVAESKALLIHHAALGIWIQPGGHVDPGERPVDAALRETLEETGVAGKLLSPQIFDMDIHEIPANPRKDEPAHYHVDVRYLVAADSRQSVEINEQECHGFSWVDLNSLSSEPTSVGRMAVLALAHIQNLEKEPAA